MITIRVYIRKSKYYYSANEQEEKIKKYCIDNGFVPSNMYIYVDKTDDHSATLSKRPALRQLLNDLIPSDMMVVLDINRIFLNSHNLNTLYKHLDDNNIYFIDCDIGKIKNKYIDEDYSAKTAVVGCRLAD